MKKIKILLFAFLWLYFSNYNFAQIQEGQLKAIPETIKEQQNKGEQFPEMEVFISAATKQAQEKYNKTISKATLLTVSPENLQRIVAQKQNNMRVVVPNAFGETYTLQLVKANIFTQDFAVKTSHAQRKNALEVGVHYRGVVEGDEHSLVAVSFFENEVMGFINQEGKNLILGKLEDKATQHILYREDNLVSMLGSLEASCEMPEDDTPYTADELALPTGTSRECVDIYLEVDHDVFLDKGNNTAAYISGLFNQSATIYANDGINLFLSELFIWDTPSPYAGGSSGYMLNQFQNYRTDFNGDLGHLVSYKSSGGIAAGFNGLCNADRRQSMCFSDIYPTYNDVPMYSWSIMVFTHEMGHLLGSRHTHACVWNGNATAIDGCAGYTEGSCAVPGYPLSGGTIMSYCHVRTVGINFNHGFGPQPANVILNNIANASCLSCDTCEEDLYLTGNIPADIYEANNSITSDGIPDPTTVVDFKAGNFILLNHGFLAASEASFLAIISECNNIMYTDDRNTLDTNKKDVVANIEAVEKLTCKVFPNPFAQETTIAFSLPETTNVHLEVFDLTGKTMAIIINNKTLSKGQHQTTFDASQFPDGIYAYRLTTEHEMITQKMIVRH